MVADPALGLEKSVFSLLISILYLIISVVLGQMEWICLDFIWVWSLIYLHIIT